MGRKTELTKIVHAQIIEALEDGCFKKHAANAAGIAEKTLHVWLARGATGEEPFASFLDDVEQAVALDARGNQKVITEAARGPIKGDWKAAAWNLERKFPRLYGRLAELEQMPREERPHSPWKQPSTPPAPLTSSPKQH